MRRRRRRVWLLGAAVIAGGAALLGAGRDGKPTPASIGGAPLDPTDPTAQTDPAAPPGSAAPAQPPPVVVPAQAAPFAPSGQVAVDLDHITRDGDGFTAPLADGRRAVLTLEPRLQALAEHLLDESRAPRGAIVAMAPDGRILALAGRRTAEPKGSVDGTFDWRLATEAWAPAASIFKLVTASALVKAGVDPDGKVCFHGGLRSVLEHNLHDDARDSRCETLTYGVAHSNNAIVGKLAFQNLAPAALEEQAKHLGWNAALTGDLLGTCGELALPKTHDLEFARAAAGFTGAKLSVMGGALVAATFAADGEQPVPRLVESIDGKAIPAPPARRAITADQARAVARMMVETCDQGSAARTFGKRGKLRVAGKTGTLTQTQPFYMEHSWFVGFAPADKPQIVVAVLLGNPESWHIRGHEAAKRLIDKALEKATRGPKS